MKQIILAALLTTVTIATTQPAGAQSGTDVVVIRRVVTPGLYSQHGWTEGVWSGAAQCSAQAAQSRTVTCVNAATGAVAPDASCRGPRPATLRAQADYRACQYRWDYGVYGDWAETCSDATFRTRTAQCTRFGQGSPEVPATDASACGARGPVREDAANRTGCSFAWVSTDGSCLDAGSRSVTSVCRRSGGSSAAVTVASGCSGPAPTTRSDATCGPRYAYTSEFGAYGACSGGQQTASIVNCVRSDNAIVALSFCTEKTKATACVVRPLTCGGFATGYTTGWTTGTRRFLGNAANATAAHDLCENGGRKPENGCTAARLASTTGDGPAGSYNVFIEQRSVLTSTSTGGVSAALCTAN